MACPLNNPAGRFEVVGFVPTLTNDECLRAGVKQSQIATLRSLLLQQCLFVVQLYGGMNVDSPVYPVELSDGTGIAMARNYLASVRADHKARLEMCALVGISRVLPNRLLACRRHAISGDCLNRIVDDPTRDVYYVNAALRRDWRELVEKIGSSDAATKRSALNDLKERGWRPVVPANFSAALFDGAHDTPEDIHHVGPLGLGLVLLNAVKPLLEMAFPPQRTHGRARAAVCGAGLITLKKRELVTWDDSDAVHVRHDHTWVRRVDNHQEGFAPTAQLITSRTARRNVADALAKFNAGLKRMSEHYVRSFKRFDFEPFVDGPVTFFNRATTLEVELLFITFVWPSVLPQSGEFDWIVELFLSYNMFYMNWRRDSYTASDFPIMEAQRVRFKNLAMQHLVQLSKTQFQTAKFEALDHVCADIVRHAGEALLAFLSFVQLIFTSRLRLS